MIQINNNWSFAKLPELNISDIVNTTQLDLSNIQLEHITIPHTWYEDGNAYEGAVIYTKKLRVDVQSHKRLFLQFKAADRWCRVYVNQVFVGEHKGGYSAFAFEITKQCKYMEANEITVLLDNRSWDTISPLAGDFTVFGGIYRNVNLIETEVECFDRTYYGTDGVIVCTDLDEEQNGLINIETRLSGTEREVQDQLSLRYTVTDRAGNEVLSETLSETLSEAALIEKIGHDNEKQELLNESSVRYQIKINHPELWNGLTNPVTYDLAIELLKDGIIIDHVEKTIGFRKISLDPETGFYLNGIHTKINGVAKHQDSAGVFNATNEENWKQDLSDLLEIGANSVRLSHYQHPQKMYELCDESGLIVWAEIPFLKINDTKEFFENAGSQLRELILQNMHHPSICFWGVQNEIAMFSENETTYEQVKGLNAIVKELDQTRISAGANLYCVENDSELNQITDAVGYNIYFGWYYGEMKDNENFIDKFHQDNPGVPLGITEYGVDCNLKFHNNHPKVKDYSEEFQALYHETVYPIFASKEYIWGTYVWNLYDFSSGVRDEGGVKYRNCKGLITYDRQTKKDSYYYYKAQWSKNPFIQIGEKRYVNRVAGMGKVKVYSNLTDITLIIEENGHRSERIMHSENGVFLFENVKIGQGDNIVKACSGEYADEVCFHGQNAKDASYVYVDASPGINVKNWFLDALEEEKLFPKGMYSIREPGTELLKSEEAMAVIEAFNKKMAEQMRKRKSAMPLERVLYYMKKEVTEEQCRQLNEELKKIKKEQ